MAQSTVSPLLRSMALVVLALAVLLVGANLGNTVTVSVLATTLPASVGVVLGLGAVLGGLGVFLLVWSQVAPSRQGQLKADLEREKAEVLAEASSDRIKALEAKVATLEKALDSALKTGKA